ncbi:hypothetical protein ACTI_01950 [Actinoplanes sp. OR16]|uniref:hypothetical protein n=1 Tax=Actinoplanes sp. OR16 TaxID=946334 RepID=UPI000F6D1C0A|nr:hypothetical protein [Actinoplanes sp. OR16]BBH63510.1 hypothetical protein ACTI_01950 [Actinoplanes sp. OR16]
MRQVYVHQAILDSSSQTAPGAAITTALCGHWEHEPPCPLAPHHTAARTEDGRLHLRVLFATEPDRVDLVRSRIDEALAGGDWEMISSGCARVNAGERDHARRLLRANRVKSE